MGMQRIHFDTTMDSYVIVYCMMQVWNDLIANA